MKKRTLLRQIITLQGENQRVHFANEQLARQIREIEAKLARPVSVHFTEDANTESDLIYRDIGMVDVRSGEQIVFQLPLESTSRRVSVRLELRQR